MMPGLEQFACPELAVPSTIMQHVVAVESSFNPYAIGVVGGRLQRQPTGLQEAVATARMLEARGYNFSVGLAQVNRHNLSRQGLHSYEAAFDRCANLQAGARILQRCHARAGGDWGKALSCYYSGNFVTGFRHGYVQKVWAARDRAERAASALPAVVAAPQTVPAAPAGQPLPPRAHGSGVAGGPGDAPVLLQPYRPSPAAVPAPPSPPAPQSPASQSSASQPDDPAFIF